MRAPGARTAAAPRAPPLTTRPATDTRACVCVCACACALCCAAALSAVCLCGAQGIQLRGMQRDSTWDGAAAQYEQIFDWAVMDQPYA
jgi:hypothetical protein